MQKKLIIPTLLLYAISVLAGSCALAGDDWPRTDFSRSTIELKEIVSGGPPKDGIPALDNPEFVAFRIADSWLNDQEPVIVVEIQDHVRAYPLQIMIFHEIVNDELNGHPISVTFCPLCNASIVFDRRLDGQILDFGTTGKLRKSDLVMYDRQTESWWQQFTGIGIVGHYAGKELKQIPSAIVSYSAFKKQYPDSLILSRDTGFSRPYGNNPYRGYDSIDDKPFLFFDTLDPRLPPMERVIGIIINRKSKIYPFSLLERSPVINDTFQGKSIAVFSAPGLLSVLDNGNITNSRLTHAAKIYESQLEYRTLEFIAKNGKIYDVQTNSEWNIFGMAISGPLKGQELKSIDNGVHFAFAWLAFRPDSFIFK